jgi:hypothetical protein
MNNDEKLFSNLKVLLALPRLGERTAYFLHSSSIYLIRSARSSAFFRPAKIFKINYTVKLIFCIANHFCARYILLRVEQIFEQSLACPDNTLEFI